MAQSERDDGEHRLRLALDAGELGTCRSRYTIEHRVVRPDGSLRWIEGRGQVLLGQDDQVLATTAALTVPTPPSARDTWCAPGRLS